SQREAAAWWTWSLSCSAISTFTSSSARTSDAFFVAQAVDEFVADDGAARRQRMDAVGRQRLGRLRRACRERGRLCKGLARQLADDLAQRLFFAPCQLFGGKQHVIGDVERGT